MQCFVIIIREEDVCYWTHPFNLVSSTCTDETRCRKDFASVALCRLGSTKRNFRFAATTWWNLLPTLIHDCTMNFINFTKAVRNFYMDNC